MSFSGISEITRTEQQSRQRYDEAVAQAKHALAVEQTVGERHLEDARKNEEVEAHRLLTEAEKNAAAHAQQRLQAAQEECEAMKADARTRLDEAAARILEKVVNS